jgi:hypothetical protein
VLNFDKPVQAKTRRYFDENDISDNNLIVRCPADFDITSGPDGRKHTVSLHPETKVPRLLQALNREIEYNPMAPGVSHLLYCRVCRANRVKERLFAAGQAQLEVAGWQ